MERRELATDGDGRGPCDALYLHAPKSRVYTAVHTRIVTLQNLGFTQRFTLGFIPSRIQCSHEALHQVSQGKQRDAH